MNADVIVGTLLVAVFVGWVVWAGRQAAHRAAGRRAHDDRDYACRYWWGDRGGYDHTKVRCLICNPTVNTFTPTPKENHR